MAFDPVFTKVPTSIGSIRVYLDSSPDPASPGEIEKSGAYAFNVLDQDGEGLSVSSGNLLPHLSPEKIQWLSDFLDWCRTQAETTLPSI